MTKAADHLLAKILIRNGLVASADIEACLELIDLGEANATTLASMLRERDLVTDEDLLHAEHAVALVQAQRYVKIACDLGYLSVEDANDALAAYRASGYDGTVGDQLLQSARLNVDQDRLVVEKDPYTLRPSDTESTSDLTPDQDLALALEDAATERIPVDQQVDATEGANVTPQVDIFSDVETTPLGDLLGPSAPSDESSNLQLQFESGPFHLDTQGTMRDLPEDCVALAELIVRDRLATASQVMSVVQCVAEGETLTPFSFLDSLVGSGKLSHLHSQLLLAYRILEQDALDFELDNYYLIGPLGFGLTGPVIHARQLGAAGEAREVALELMPPGLAASPERFESFRSRCGAVSFPPQTSLAQALDSGRAGEAYFIARSLPPGESLAERIASGQLLSEPEALQVAMDLATALRTLSAYGIVHGGLRPENIVVGADGRAVLRYVGITPAPQPPDPDQPPPCGDLPTYLAPEALVGDPLDSRSDLYGLGCSLYEGITGRKPLVGDTSAAIIEQALCGHQPNLRDHPNLSERFVAIVAKLMAAAPDARYSGPQELLDDLAGAASGGTGSDLTVIGGHNPATREHTDPPPSDISSSDPLIGAKVTDRYRLLRKIGAGGMGVVYLADHLLLRKPVALKILHPRLLSNPESVRRFHREAKAASRFRHDNVVRIYDAGDYDCPTGKIYYMALEYVEGTNLHALIHKQGALPISRARRIMRQVLAAAHAAHSHAIVHRDMKTDNVMITQSGDGSEIAKIMDFGVAKIMHTDSTQFSAGHTQQSFKTSKGVITGTPQYMSPEQAAGDSNIDARADIYSLGIVLYEMVIGDLPFKSNTAMGYLGKHILEAPIAFKAARPDLTLPVGLQRVILKALEKDRTKRYQTAADMLADLEAAFPAGEETQALEVQAAGGPKRKIIIGLVVVTVVLTALVLWVMLGP